MWKLLRLWVLDWLDDPELVKRKIQALLSDERETARKDFEASQQSIKEQQADAVREQAAVAELEPEEDEEALEPGEMMQRLDSLPPLMQTLSANMLLFGM